MNSKQNKIKRYLQLDALLRNPEGHTLNELLYRLDDDISKRSLQDNLKEFEDDFNAQWDLQAYRGRERLWRYKDSDFSIFKQVNLDLEVINKAIGNLALFRGDPRYDWLRFYLMGLENGIQNSTNLMSFDHNEDYIGLEHMEELAQAIIHHYPIRLTYRPFGKTPFETNVHPYHLRQYNRRWYLFGFSEDKNKVLNYPLDRIEAVEHLSKAYLPTEISFDEYFDDIVGVTNYEEKEIEKIKLRVNKKSVNYIRTKPIHWSQKEMKELEDENYVVMQLKVKVNTELQMMLFSYSDAIEVVEPLWLREKIISRIQNMNDMYKV